MMDEFEKEMEKFLESGAFDIKLTTNHDNNILINQNKLVENFQNYLNTANTEKTNQINAYSENLSKTQQIQNTNPLANEELLLNSNPSMNQLEEYILSSKDKQIIQVQSKSKEQSEQNCAAYSSINQNKENQLKMLNDTKDKSISNLIDNTDEIIIKQSPLDFEKLVEEEEAKGTYNLMNEDQPKEPKFKYVKKQKYVDKYKITEPPNEAPKYRYYADRFKQIDPVDSKKTNNSTINEIDSSKPIYNITGKQQIQAGKKEKKYSKSINASSTSKKDDKPDEVKETKQSYKENNDLALIKTENNNNVNDIHYNQTNTKNTNSNQKEKIPKTFQKQTKSSKLKSLIIIEEKKPEKEKSQEDNANMLNFEDDDNNIKLTKRPVSSTIKIENKNNNSNTIPITKSEIQKTNLTINSLDNKDFNSNFKNIQFIDEEQLYLHTNQINNIIPNNKSRDNEINTIYQEDSNCQNTDQIAELIPERNMNKKFFNNTFSGKSNHPEDYNNRIVSNHSEKRSNIHNARQNTLINSIRQFNNNNISSATRNNNINEQNTIIKIDDANKSDMDLGALSATKKLNDIFYSKSNQSIDEDCYNDIIIQQTSNYCTSNITQTHNRQKQNPVQSMRIQEEDNLQLELQLKIEELTQNAKLVREENEKLINVKAEYHLLTTQLRSDIDEFQRQKEKEKKDFEKFKEEEYLRLEKEKRNNQKNIKQMHENEMISSKKEKEELNSIKEQYAKLQEDTKQKEIRNKKAMDCLKRKYEEAIEHINDLKKELKMKEEELINIKLLYKPSNNANNKPPSSKNTQQRQLSKEKIDHQAIEGNTNQSDSYSLTSKENNIVQQNKTLKRNNSLTDKSSFKIKQNLTNSNDKVSQKDQLQQNISNTIKIQEIKHQMQLDNLQDNHPEEDYEMVFLNKYHYPLITQTPLIQQNITHDGKTIKVYQNNRKEIIFPSGLRKELFPDGYQVTYLTNKDIRQFYPNGKEVYKYYESNTIQTKFPDGLQVFKFSNGQLEKNFIDGTKIINYPDGTIRNVYPDNYEEIFFPDGSLQKIDSNGIITIDHVDGAKDTIYPNGSKVSELPDGRVINIEKDCTTQNYFNKDN